MKINHGMMTVFLILMIGSSMQFRIPQNMEDKALQNSNDSGNDQRNEEVRNQTAITNQPSSQNSGNGVQDTKQVNSTDQASSNQLSERATLYDDATQWNDDGKKAINHLDRHTINCTESNSAINSFKFEHRLENSKKRILLGPKKVTKIRFSFTCVKSPAISNTCFDYTTPVGDAAFMVRKSLNYLVRHYVECPNGQVMKSFVMKTAGKFYTGIGALFRLGEKDRPKLWYKFTCCNAEISRTVRAETKRTDNKNNEYFNLSRQDINGRDFNAISSFNMLAPPNTIFYNMRLSVLNGETSPYFPDPCMNASENSSQDNPVANDKSASFSDSESFVGNEFIYF
jgi:hypothetical protein